MNLMRRPKKFAQSETSDISALVHVDTQKSVCFYLLSLKGSLACLFCFVLLMAVITECWSVRNPHADVVMQHENHKSHYSRLGPVYMLCCFIVVPQTVW